MPIHRWSEQIAIVEFGDEPQFSEDAANFRRLLQDEQGLEPSAVFDLSRVSYLNSMNVAQLIQLRNQLMGAGRKLRVCSVDDKVWGVMMLARLDSMFEFAPDVATALTSIQLTE